MKTTIGFRNRLFVSENAIVPGVYLRPRPPGLISSPHDWCLCVMWACDVTGKPSQRSRVVVAPESFQCRSKVVVVGTLPSHSIMSPYRYIFLNVYLASNYNYIIFYIHYYKCMCRFEKAYDLFGQV